MSQTSLLDEADNLTSFVMPDTVALVEQYQQMVYAIAVTHTHCLGDADDVFQETFLTYQLKQPLCTSDEHVKAWLIRVTLTCARRMSHSSWRTRVVPLTADEADQLPAAFQARSDDQQVVFDALSRLPETYRTVLHLFYIEDLPVADIAVALGLNPGTVKVRLSRGRELMRAHLKEDSHA